jgi:uncharacterized metal-binding protein YceD (DUF177 family)
MIRISVDDLKESPQRRELIQFNEVLPITDAVKPVVGELVLAMAAGGVKLTGNVKSLLKLQCQTCLRPYFHALNVDIDEYFVPHRDALGDFEMGAPRDKELLKDDFYDEVPADGFIDISDVVYQAVTLASPVFSRCGDECPGPPKSEGTRGGSVSGSDPEQTASEKPIDPRWKNLKTLFPNQE